ncbi:MAG: site-specific integrase [Methanoregula sp.]|jgi:integrase|nr:site-specific integrase [Methanoregula sp.]
MRATGGHITYLNAAKISQAEREILLGFIDQRNAVKPTGERTKGKQAYEGFWICEALHRHESALDTCTVKDLLKVAGDASSGAFTKNSRQTKIVTLKAIAKYIHRFDHKIQNLDLLMDDVKAGSVAKNRKEALSLEEWDRLINLPMSARDRAILAVMYDGYHRPKEVLLLRWCDLHTNDRGDIEYEITFKTEKTRTIVQKPGTTEILELWRRECGASLTDNKPIFPAPDGNPYETITVLAKLFDKLKEETGITGLKPSVLRNSALTHDVESGLPVSYICLRAWGEPYNELINLYTKPDSGKIQRDQHDKDGMQPAVLGRSGKFATKDDRDAERDRTLAKLQKDMEIMQEILKNVGSMKS